MTGDETTGRGLLLSVWYIVVHQACIPLNRECDTKEEHSWNVIEGSENTSYSQSNPILLFGPQFHVDIWYPFVVYLKVV